MNPDLIARYYWEGLYSVDDLEVFVAAGYIGEEQKHEIESKTE